LCAEAERLGFRKLVSRIFPENLARLALRRKVGFGEVGIYRRHDKLDGKWRYCVIVEKLLGEASATQQHLRLNPDLRRLWSTR
jgi:L-amino acid N-acyltransferase YncA